MLRLRIETCPVRSVFGNGLRRWFRVPVLRRRSPSRPSGPSAHAAGAADRGGARRGLASPRRFSRLAPTPRRPTGRQQDDDRTSAPSPVRRDYVSAARTIRSRHHPLPRRRRRRRLLSRCGPTTRGRPHVCVCVCVRKPGRPSSTPNLSGRGDTLRCLLRGTRVNVFITAVRVRPVIFASVF